MMTLIFSLVSAPEALGDSNNNHVRLQTHGHDATDDYSVDEPVTREQPSIEVTAAATGYRRTLVWTGSRWGQEAPGW